MIWLTIPAYVVAWLLTARILARRVFDWALDEDRIPASVVCGMFWPAVLVVAIFYGLGVLVIGRDQ